MAGTLDLGELEATITVDDQQFEQGLDQAEGRFQQWGDRLQMAGALAGAAVGAALTAALVEAMELDAAQAELTAAIGDPEYAKELGAVAGRMYTEGWGESVRDNMDAVRSVMASGLLGEDATDEAIQRTSTQAVALAQVFQQDVGQAARAAGQLIRNGLAADAEQAFDVLARGFQQTGNLADDLLDTVSEYSPQWAKLGITGVEAMGLLSQGMRAGARDTDFIADALKEFAIRAADGSTTSADAFKAIGLNAEQMTRVFAKGGPDAARALDLVLDKLRAMKDPVAREAAAVGLFGTKAEDLQKALFALDLDTAAAEMGNVAGAAEGMTNALGQSASAQLESFKRKVTEALVHEVARAIPLLTALGEWASRNKEVLIPLVGALGGLAAIIAVVAAITKVWAIAQMALNVAMALNPIGLIIIAIVALVAGIAILYAKVDWFREGINTFFGWIIAAAKLWWQVFSTFWTTVGAWFVALFSAWWQLFSGFWLMIFNGASDAYQFVVDKVAALVSFVTGLPGRLAAAGRGMWDFVWTTFRSVINAVLSRWNRLSFKIPGVSVPGLGQVWGGMTLDLPDVPLLNVGGDIVRTGLAVVHAGERVVPAAQAKRLHGGDGGGETTVHVIVDGTGMFAGMRREAKGKGGGNVQLAFGSNPF